MAGYPGAYPDYISVAAVAADGTPSSYSNYAHGVSICAPGGDSDYHQSPKGKIYSTIPSSASEDGGNYGYMEGTSQACPHVSGVAALGLSYAAKLHRHFRADEFRKMMLELCQAGRTIFHGNESILVHKCFIWPNCSRTDGTCCLYR